jgi:hypothetical protein
MRMNSTILVLASALAAGCAATGDRYGDDAAQRGAVQAQAARVMVYRPADTLQYSGRAASLALDGAPAAALRLGGFLAFDVAPGEHRLEIDMWDAPGRCALSFTAQPGSTSYFEVAPRVANLAAGTPGALMGTGSPLGLLAGLSLMLGGMAAESAGKACGGAFAIAQVDAAVAEPKLGGLRASR